MDNKLTFKEDRFNLNEEERDFVEYFSKFTAYQIEQIVFGSNERGEPKGILSERELSIVVSTIQWLGSPAGQGFLYEMGYE